MLSIILPSYVKIFEEALDTHYATGFVVVQVHLLPKAAAPLASVHEHPGELVPEVYVIRTPAPFPVLDARNRVLDVRATPLVCGVARASLDHALRARPGHRVRYARAGDRVDERRLPETCGSNNVRPRNAYVNNFINTSAVSDLRNVIRCLVGERGGVGRGGNTKTHNEKHL